MENQIVVLDFETQEIFPDGTTKASTEAYRPNFRAFSAAIAYREGKEIRTEFADGEDAVATLLTKLVGAKVVVHNAQFEELVLRCRFPAIPVKIYADTMRMGLVWDNGGNEYSFEMVPNDDPNDDTEMEKRWLLGFSLVKMVERILKLPDHKTEAHTWIRDNLGVKNGKEGGHLDKLPTDILQRYNEADVTRTLLLYEHLEEQFLLQEYDWRFDHELYLSTVGFTVDAKRRGVLVDREKLQVTIPTREKEIADISQAFKDKYAPEIVKVERMRLLKRIRKLKTLKGRKKFLRNNPQGSKAWQKDVAFNAGSNAQLAQLFVDILGIQPEFLTATGLPSFKSALLGQWGDGGLLLQQRRKSMIVYNQAKSLDRLSEYDGRWHLNLKLSSTKTGRASGGEA